MIQVFLLYCLCVYSQLELKSNIPPEELNNMGKGTRLKEQCKSIKFAMGKVLLKTSMVVYKNLIGT